MNALSGSKNRESRLRVKKYVFERDGGACYYCNAPLTPITMTLDHIVPRSLGGQTNVANLCCACPVCNYKKANREPINFVRTVLPNIISRRVSA